MSVTRLRVCLPLLAVLALGLGGCGSDGSSSAGSDHTPSPGTPSASVSDVGSASASTSPSTAPPPGTPDCTTVWRDGATIPRAYRGCVGADGAYVRKDGLGCSSGQAIIRFADRFYGVAGGTVHGAATPLLSDRDYRAAILRCRA